MKSFTVKTLLGTEGAFDREMSAANQKKQALANRFADTYRAYQWLQENRNEFQGQIYGPIMLEVSSTVLLNLSFVLD